MGGIILEGFKRDLKRAHRMATERNGTEGTPKFEGEQILFLKGFVTCWCLKTYDREDQITPTIIREWMNVGKQELGIDWFPAQKL